MGALAVQPHLFAYDESAPLRLSLEGERAYDGAKIAAVGYDNGVGGRVSAVLIRPTGQARDHPAGIVLAHGGFEPGKHLFLAHAVELSRSGFAVLAADTTFPRAGDAAAVEHAVRVAVVTHRRSLDVLGSLCGADRLGFFGHSRGGSEAAILSAVEPRLGAIVIGGIGSPSARRRREAQRSPQAAYFAAVFGFDAAAYVRVPGPRRLLVQHGRSDSAVTREEGRAMFDGASEPKLWREYDCGHDVVSHGGARSDRIAFFDGTL